MSDTYTNSISNTYSEARGRYVLGKVYEVLMNLLMVDLITKSFADECRTELLYLMDKKALKSFEFQFRTPGGSEIGGLHYEVRADSSIVIDDDSGGVDFWGLNKTTKVSLNLTKDKNSPYIDEVNRQLTAWGYGPGSALTGSSTQIGSFSKGGFGVNQSKIGSW